MNIIILPDKYDIWNIIQLNWVKLLTYPFFKESLSVQKFSEGFFVFNHFEMIMKLVAMFLSLLVSSWMYLFKVV